MNASLFGQTINFDTFVSNYSGQATDYDGAYGVQCVDLILLYIRNCLTGKEPEFKGNAKEWWTSRNDSTWLKNNFEFITPTYKKDNEVQKGDIGVKTSGGGGNGHIFIIAGSNVNDKFSYYDQNGTGKHDSMTLRMGVLYNKNTINGILRPKNQSKLGNPIPILKPKNTTSGGSSGGTSGGSSGGTSGGSSGTGNNNGSTVKDTSAEEIKYLKKILKNKTKVSSAVKNVTVTDTNKQNRTFVQTVWRHFTTTQGSYIDRYVPIKEGAKITWERKGTPGQFNFEVVYDDNHKYNIQEGDCIIVSLCKSNGTDPKTMFVGYVFTKKISKDRIYSYVAYDQLRYLKNKDFLIYKKKTASQVIKTVAKRMNLKCGTIADTKYKMSAIEEGSECFDIIQDALDNTMLEKSQIYVLFDNCGKLTLKNINDMKRNSCVVDVKTAQDYSLETSIDSNTYNRVKIVYEKTNKDDNKTTYHTTIYQSSKSINQWGVLQLYEKVDNIKVAKLKAEAYMNMYNAKTKSLTVKDVIGDRQVRAGSMVPVIMNLPGCEISSYLLVEKVTHKFENNKHTMDLVLSGGGFNGK